ncbi:MAG: hypothetical protein ABFD14_00960 [Anaerolineaceae bacterium]
MLSQFSLVFIFLSMASVLAVLILPRFRWVIYALAIQYLAAFFLSTQTLSLGLALIKLLIGWMITALFASISTTIEKKWNSESVLSGIILRVTVMIGLWIVLYIAAPAMKSWLPVPLYLLMGGLFLLSGGIIQFGLSNQVMRVCIGLLTFMSGFEVIYASLEPSVMVSGLLALVNIGIGLVGILLTMRMGPDSEVVE